MIIKDISKTEFCSLCNRGLPDGSVVLRKQENGKVLCILCLVEIAELSINTLPTPKITRQENE